MSKLKILVVEDDIVNLEIIVQFLGEQYEVKVAFDGENGIKIYKEFKPDIIITDLDMPVLNGIDMLKYIRVFDKNVKAIVLTSHAGVDYLLKATELNLTKYLLKPISKIDLFDSISLALNEIQRFKVIDRNILNINEKYAWDFQNNILLCAGVEVRLTPKEKKILEYLFKNRPNIVSYEDLIEFVWNDYDFVDKKALKTMMSGLRKKIPQDLIGNIYGVGYKVCT